MFFWVMNILFKSVHGETFIHTFFLHLTNCTCRLRVGMTFNFFLNIIVYLFSFSADWATECVSRAEILRLIYQGRFLHSSVTLGALGLPLGRTTVMHLVPREHLPEPNSHGMTLRLHDTNKATYRALQSYYRISSRAMDEAFVQLRWWKRT